MNTQKYSIPNIFFSEERKTKWITLVGLSYQHQEQQILTNTGEISNEALDNNHGIYGGWLRVTTDLSIGMSTSGEMTAFSTHYRIYESESLDWYGGASVFGNYGVQTSLSFKDVYDQWFPFVSVQYRQLHRSFNSYNPIQPSNFVNSVSVLEEITDYQIGFQMKQGFIKRENFENIRIQMFIGSSNISKTNILSETFTSNYVDKVGATFGFSLFNEF